MKKITILMLSYLFVWIVEILRLAKVDNFDFDFFIKWLFTGLGVAAFMVLAGLIVGGFVLLNIFLFFYNLINPSNKLAFDLSDKVIAGNSSVIIFELINLLK